MHKAWLRWWPLLYVALFGFEAAYCWGAHSLLFLRLGISCLSFTGSMWFLAWRYADRARRREEAQKQKLVDAELKRMLMRASGWLN